MRAILFTIITLAPIISLLGQRNCADDGIIPYGPKRCILESTKTQNDTSTIIIDKFCTDLRFDSLRTGFHQIFKQYKKDVPYLYLGALISNGQLDGKATEYYQYGQPYSTLTYSKGRLIGPAIYYNKRGEIITEGVYSIQEEEEGFFTGNHFQYWDSGNMASKTVVKNNHILKEYYWNDEGDKIKKEAFDQLWDDCE